MNEKITVAGFLGLIVLAIAVACELTDLLFLVAGIGFFALCLVYTRGCGKL